MTAGTAPREEDVLTRVVAILREVIAEPWAEEAAIGPETSFHHDLELESIEFVVLAERLQEAYGPRVDFAAWLADLELEQILSLRVGEVVAYICRCLA